MHVFKGGSRRYWQWTDQGRSVTTHFRCDPEFQSGGAIGRETVEGWLCELSLLPVFIITPDLQTLDSVLDPVAPGFSGLPAHTPPASLTHCVCVCVCTVVFEAHTFEHLVPS